MDLDLILFWLALFSSVLLLLQGRGACWNAKALALILGAGALVMRNPDVAGWAVGTAWLLLLALPWLLGEATARMSMAQNFAVAVPLARLAVLL
ncbi:MAG: hypothetical protein JO326_08065, partial [Acetobacteraceae bacterium]|nr:hypothetical protein [Acetobacteraceae bacterium]